MLQRVEPMTGAAEPAAAAQVARGAKRLPAIPAFKPRDRYIPVTRGAILKTLSAPELWPGYDPAEVRACFRYLAHWRHLNYADRGMELIESYQPFNPDRDTAASAISAEAGSNGAKPAFIQSVRAMLERANYDEIPRAGLQAVIDEENPYGLELEVNLDEFSEIILYVRGESTDVVKPDLSGRLRGKKPVDVAVFQRVFLLLCLKHEEERVKEVMVADRVSEARARKTVTKNRKVLPPNIDDSHIYIKMFKDMPRPDLEVIFPIPRSSSARRTR